MEWTESLRNAVAYMEAHLCDTVTVEEAAKAAHIPPFYLQKGFKVMTGYSLMEYVRYRRLYLAALEVLAGGERVIDLAYKYGYETPESFTKAFTRFHGVSPMQLKGNAKAVRIFLPLQIELSVYGGDAMDYTVEKMNGFTVIGLELVCSEEESSQAIPRFWETFWQNYCRLLQRLKRPENAVEQAILDCGIGEFGVCTGEGEKAGTYRYLIAGRYSGGEVPEGMRLFDFPALEWAKFRCIGPMPGAIQAGYERIVKEWLPGNPEYETALECEVEWYSPEYNGKADYKSEIWIPVAVKSRP